MPMLRPARVHRGSALLGALVLAVSLAACSSGSTPGASSAPGGSASAEASASAASSAAGGNAVTIQGFAFGPATLDVAVGTTVTWTNKDSATHTVTANDNSFDGQVASNQTFTQTFSKAGSFAYHCKIHPSMTATITVH